MRVVYRGLKLSVSTNVNYIATDESGNIYGYQDSPIFNKETGCWGNDLDWVEPLIYEGSNKDYESSLESVKDLETW